MEYSLDISDPLIQDAMNHLQISPNDLLFKNLSTFEGSEKVQKLRYEHHINRVKKLTKEIKNYLKPSKFEKNFDANTSLNSDSITSQESSLNKMKVKHRLNLSLQIQLENQKRDLLSSSIQKLFRKDFISEKIKNDIERKKKFDRQKKEQIEMRLKSILNQQKQKTQDLSNRLSRVNSRLSNSPLKSIKSVRSSFSERLPSESVYPALDMLRDINRKLEKSQFIHQSNVRVTASRAANHNEKVEKTLNSQKSIREYSENNKILDFIGKIDDIDTRRNVKQNRIEEHNKKKLLKEIQKFSKIKDNLADEEKKITSNINKLENKEIEKKNILLCQIEEVNKEKEYRNLKHQLRGDDARENLERSKRNYLRKREKLLEKHLEMMKKVDQMKEEKEKNNEKIRIEAIKAKLDQIKAKELHVLINKANDPNSVSKLIEKSFN